MMGPLPKPKWLPIRKRMTLIAAFRSPGSSSEPSGIVVCADSQETVTQYDQHGNPYEVKVAVQKIEPIHKGRVEVAIAGSGNAILIEVFIERATRILQAHPEIENLNQVRDTLERTLKHFYANDIRNCPDADKEVKLWVLVSCPSAMECGLLVSDYAVLRTPKYPILNGIEHAMYYQTANRLATENITLPQAVLASIYTLTIAKHTSHNVSGVLTVAIVTNNGIWMESPNYVEQMESRLASYEKNLNQIFLTCADTSVSTQSLIQSLNRFEKEATELHREQILSQVRGLNLEQIAKTNDPYPKFPLGTSVIFGTDGKFLAIEDPEHKPDVDAFAEKVSSIMGSPQAYQAVTLYGKDGRKAVLDFSGDEVTYSGDLPVSEAAKVFFDHVLLWSRKANEGS